MRKETFGESVCSHNALWFFVEQDIGWTVRWNWRDWALRVAWGDQVNHRVSKAQWFWGVSVGPITVSYCWAKTFQCECKLCGKELKTLRLFCDNDYCKDQFARIGGKA